MRMIKTLFVFAGIALATMVAPAVVKAQEYYAVAANPYGYAAARSYESMNDARWAAVNDCENETDEPCHYFTVAERSNWHFVVIECLNGRGNSVGASQFSFEMAAQVASTKIRGCRYYRTLAKY